MTRLRVGIIGTGKPVNESGATGWGTGYWHAAGYRALPEQCELVACADINLENAEAFARANGIPAEGIFADHRTMLATARLDVVSVCVWPHLHAPLTIDCALAGVRAIHCEKPMADAWGAARLMAQECERRGVRLTINHQRRFGAPFTIPRDLLAGGAIGELSRVEITCDNIYDWGTHYIDLCDLYAGEQAAEWVMGQIDYRTEQLVFGAHVENQAVGIWQYPSGVFGLIATGPGSLMVGADIRLIGADGTIEIGVHNGPVLRVRRVTGDWETIDTRGEHLHGPGYHERAIADVIGALLEGRESQLSARHALNATEIIFALYESSRQRGRITLPLTIVDHPLVAMLEAGELRPAPAAGSG